MSRVQTKICGLSTPDTLDAAIAGGASHVGFVFFPPSPRNVTVERANELSAVIPHEVKTVGVFVDPSNELLDRVLKIVRLDVIQLHGSESPQRLNEIRRATGREIWKAVPVKTKHDLVISHTFGDVVDRLIYDSRPPPNDKVPGGTGVRFDWTLLANYRHSRPWALSGGLDASNVAEAVAVTGARLVDVSSGVECAPGVKDVDKVAAFLKAVARL